MKFIKHMIPWLLMMWLLPAQADKNDSMKAINQAQVLIESAVRSGAQQHAPMLLQSARDRLAQARVKQDDRDWVEAEIAAKMSQRDAEVADAKSLHAKALKAYEDLQTTVNVLRAELERKRSQQ
ncbi:DUF4398 domain-containing protein [Marinicella meishanensis]|uniref:DUF4398 domain-containing protein n=1 Tax=Marinicella meishanensis TaxID=2873263 RepID=UPI001CBBF568|nr:DUF4398 domain-containing protein [Marinicella sp. NBU2979]